MIICSAIVFVYCSNANGLVSYRRPRKNVSKGVMRTKMSLIKETTSSVQLKIGFGKVFVERLDWIKIRYVLYMSQIWVING